MDPKAALDRAEEALKDGDTQEAKYALRDYAQWRSRGGFQPTGGDARAKRIDKKILGHGPTLRGLSGAEGFVLDTHVRDLNRALDRLNKPRVRFNMVDAWWPVLARAIERLDNGRVPSPSGGYLSAPAQVEQYDHSTGVTSTWSPGAEEAERHRRYLKDRETNSAAILPTKPSRRPGGGVNGTVVDVMLALDEVAGRRTADGTVARDMLIQWLADLGIDPEPTDR